jgi:FkbM family methyltransferase
MAGWSTPLEIVRRTVGRPSCTIFDVGANVGNMTELYRLMFEEPVIHAFEPQPEVFAELERRFGQTAGVTLNRVALGAHSGTARLYQNSDRATSSLLPLYPESSWARQLGLTPQGELEVPLDTVDDYCAARGIDAIDLMKLDIQGFEPDCLKGATRMLGRRAIRVVQVEIITHRKYQRRTTFLDIESILAPCGYRLFSVLDVIGNERGELLVLDALYVLEQEFP